jgi:hypothetical protein
MMRACVVRHTVIARALTRSRVHAISCTQTTTAQKKDEKIVTEKSNEAEQMRADAEKRKEQVRACVCVCVRV